MEGWPQRAGLVIWLSAGSIAPAVVVVVARMGKSACGPALSSAAVLIRKIR
jgi:hypothetical protein